MAKRLVPLIPAVLLLSLVFAVACGGDDDDEQPTATPPASVSPTDIAEPTQPGAPDEVQLTDADDGATVELSDGGTLIVALPSNPTTGYSWSVSEDSDPQLELQGDPEYVPAGSTSPVAGAGGTEVFTFEAIGTGSASLKLEYRRPFEPDATPEDTFEVTVTIR